MNIRYQTGDGKSGVVRTGIGAPMIVRLPIDPPDGYDWMQCASCEGHYIGTQPINYREGRGLCERCDPAQL